jgi:E3 ubiquitin-protein ligase HUWE1
LVGPNAVQFFQQLLSRGNGGEIVGLEVPSAGIVATVDRSGNIFRHTHAYTSLQQPPLREGSEDSETFSPAPTAIRWSDEAKVTQSGNEALRATRVGQHLIAILLPQARIAIQEQEQVERQRQREQEEKEKAAQEEKEKTAQVEKEKSVSVESDSEQRSPQSTEHTAAAAVPSLDVRPSSPTQPPDTPADLVDPAAQLVDNAAQAMQEISVADDHVGAETLSNQEENAGETRLAEPERELEPQAGPSRIHVQIHGTAVDITDTGIDPAFLEALPDDMREEVLNQQLREQRSAAAASQVSRDQGSQINSEFLEALPPEIRAELLDQEAEQARRRAQQTASAAPATSGGPAEIDSATFLASLDPGLRQVVLMEQDETFLETLPPALLAEVTHYREADQSRYVQARQPREQTVPESSMPRRLQPPRDAIHLLDKAGVTTLIRFLFYPQVLRKNTLQKVIINLCENNKTRTEVYQSVLSVLVEVTDPALLERSSHGISKWGKSGQQHSYGKSPSKSRASGVTEAGGLSLNRAVHDSGLTPQLIVQRCIETLNDVAGATESSPIFFLSEQEQPISLRRGSSKKGKGKEREKPISSPPHFPLSLLLSLLDSDFFLKNTAMMDSLVALLAIVTKPLVVELPKSSPKKEPPVHDQSQTNESPNSESHPDEGNTASTGKSFFNLKCDQLLTRAR